MYSMDPNIASTPISGKLAISGWAQANGDSGRSYSLKQHMAKLAFAVFTQALIVVEDDSLWLEVS